VKKQAFLEQIDKHKDFIYKTCLMYCAGLEQRKKLETKIFTQLWRSLQNNSSIEDADKLIRNVILNSVISFIPKQPKKNNKQEVKERIIENVQEVEFDSI